MTSSVQVNDVLHLHHVLYNAFVDIFDRTDIRRVWVAKPLKIE